MDEAGRRCDGIIPIRPADQRAIGQAVVVARLQHARRRARELIGSIAPLYPPAPELHPATSPPERIVQGEWLRLDAALSWGRTGPEREDNGPAPARGLPLAARRGIAAYLATAEVGGDALVLFHGQHIDVYA